MNENFTFRAEGFGDEAVLPKDDGRHLIYKDEDGTEIFCDVKDREVIGYEGQRAGKPLELLLVQMRKAFGVGDDNGAGQVKPARCYICSSGSDGGYTCWPVPC